MLWIQPSPRSISIFLWDFYAVPDRTNNKVEGWHSGIKWNFGGANPTFWRFLLDLKDELLMLELPNRTPESYLGAMAKRVPERRT